MVGHSAYSTQEAPEIWGKPESEEVTDRMALCQILTLGLKMYVTLGSLVQGEAGSHCVAQAYQLPRS